MKHSHPRRHAALARAGVISLIALFCPSSCAQPARALAERRDAVTVRRYHGKPEPIFKLIINLAWMLLNDSVIGMNYYACALRLSEVPRTHRKPPSHEALHPRPPLPGRSAK